MHRFEQKGIRDYLLCEDCEGEISKFEDYVRRIFYVGVGVQITNGNPIFIQQIVYRKFKLFLLSLIWRASVSNNEFLENVSLGPDEEKIRKMLINRDPGSYHVFGAGIPELMEAFNRSTQKQTFDYLCV